MNSPCIFGLPISGRDCQHAECKIIRTIKKINRPIFKKKKHNRKERSDHHWSDDSSSSEEIERVENKMKEEDKYGRS